MSLSSLAATQPQPRGAAGSRYREPQRGSARVKSLFWLAVLAAMVYVGIKVVPILLEDYEFQDAMQTMARFASVNRQSADDIRKSVMEEAEKDQIPVQPEDVQVHGQNGNVQIEAGYSVTVDLGIYQWTLNFHPSVSNNAL